MIEMFNSVSSFVCVFENVDRSIFQSLFESEEYLSTDDDELSLPSLPLSTDSAAASLLSLSSRPTFEASLPLFELLLLRDDICESGC